MPTTTGALTSTESWTPTSSRCQRSCSFVASRSGRPTYAVVPLRETTLIASGSRPNRRRMSATAMYGRDVRYRRRLDVLGRLDSDMSFVGSLRLRARWRGVPGLRPSANGREYAPTYRSPNTLRRTNRTLAGRSAIRRMKYGHHSVPYGT